MIGDPIDNCACYTPDEYSDEFAHTLGDDCIEGTPDDFQVTHA